MRLIETDSRAANGAAGTNASTPELKELVTEATRALARLDVARLEELALSCQALTRIPVPTTKEERGVFVDKARAARGEMAVFARVLEATRANLKVMERLREIRAGKAEYLESSKGCGSFNSRDTEGGHGNN
ncbi:MAG: hypothetical protein WBE74_03435 [Terracidiphilus sp.]